MIIKNKTNVTCKIFEDNKISIKYNKIINQKILIQKLPKDRDKIKKRIQKNDESK